jgi:hypothetical protein
MTTGLSQIHRSFVEEPRMSTKATYNSVAVLVLLALASTSGCSSAAMVSTPTFGLLCPIPVSPYCQKAAEDKAWAHERYDRMPVLGPLTPGAPHVALDPPSDDEVMRELEKSRSVQGGLPMLYETQRTNVRIVTEPIADYIDPPRVYPLVGPAQLHHAHYKSIVYFTEITRVGWPLPYTVRNEECQEVIYIDHDHLHAVGNLDYGAGTNY